VLLTPEIPSISAQPGASASTPLSAIAERRSASGESDDDDDEEEGGWRSAKCHEKPKGSTEESVIKAGYLWKKGERRKVCLHVHLELMASIFRLVF